MKYYLRRGEVETYRECPIKLWLMLKGVKPPATRKIFIERPIGAALGRIGEEVFKEIALGADKRKKDEISKKVALKVSEKYDLDIVRSLKETRVLVEKTFTLLETIRDIYGDFRLIGRGYVKSAYLPARGMPDFILETQKGKLIVLDVKNTLNYYASHKEQMAFYHTLVRYASGLYAKLKDETFITSVKEVDYLLFYPKLEKIVKVDEEIPDEDIKGTWLVKLLVNMDVIPWWRTRETCSYCRYKKFCKLGEEVELESWIPVTVAFAKHLEEKSAIKEEDVISSYPSFVKEFGDLVNLWKVNKRSLISKFMEHVYLPSEEVFFYIAREAWNKWKSLPKFRRKIGTLTEWFV